mgnify:CR=1 FL=1|jgi:predicted membrane protein
MRLLGNRYKIERRFREPKSRTKKFYNNVNPKTLKSMEKIATAITIVHNLVRMVRKVIPTLTVPYSTFGVILRENR